MATLPMLSTRAPARFRGFRSRSNVAFRPSVHGRPSHMRVPAELLQNIWGKFAISPKGLGAPANPKPLPAVPVVRCPEVSAGRCAGGAINAASFPRQAAVEDCCRGCLAGATALPISFARAPPISQGVLLCCQTCILVLLLG